MAIQIFSAFFILLVLMHNAAGSLQLDVNPSHISPGQTESLTVNCSFTYVQMSNISGIISLIVSKSDQQQKYQDLISINAFSPDQINVLSQVDGSMLGHIDGNGESFLTIQWSYPESDHAGMYRCSAHGMDNAGYPAEVIQTAMVTSDLPDTSQLIAMVNDLQSQLDLQEDIGRNQTQNIEYLTSQLGRQENLTNHLITQLDRQQEIERNQSQNIDYLNLQLDHQENITSQQSNLIDTLLSLIRNQSDMINNQESQVNTIQAKLDNFKLVISNFYISDIYRNHVYLLSKSDWNNATVAEQTCEDYMGYLAEVDDADEDTFLNKFLAFLSGGVYEVLISGTNQNNESEWTYTGSSRNMSYINWYSGEPNETDNNCMTKNRLNQFQMHDYPCFHNLTDHTFLCEVNLE